MRPSHYFALPTEGLRGHLAARLALLWVVCCLAVGACSSEKEPEKLGARTWHVVQDDDDAGAYYSVWAGSPSDVWIVGGEAGKPVVRHFDGSTWSRRDPPLGGKLRWVHGDGAGNVLVVGDGGEAARWDGASWTAMPTGHPKATLWGAWLGADGQAWTVGGVDGAANATETTDRLLLLHRDAGGTAWADVPLAARADWPQSAESRIFKVWRDEASGEVFACGGRAIVAQGKGGADWTSALSDPSGAPLFTIHGRSATDVWAVGGSLGVLLVHYDGAAWASVEPPDDAPFVVQGLHVHPDGVVEIVGAVGWTARRDGEGRWWSSTADTGHDLHGVAFDGERTWAVGGDIAIDRDDHKGVVLCDDASVPAF
ncbi:MAG: hypothetical protein H6747_14755 [Deltaproteobacteria bacterium]|nr:hypothetical protein [Deltaproteobacteria bacterium]